jgi:hypothetical protein
MAIYRIYPVKDAFISSEPTIAGSYPNTGKDEILEIGSYPDLNNVGRTNRALLQFKSEDISSAITTINGASYSVNLKLYLAEAGEIPQTFNIFAHNVTGSWINGIGKRVDEPVNTSGVSWKYRGELENEWGTLGGDFDNDIIASQSFDLNSDYDINMDVKSLVDAQAPIGAKPNAGLLLKLSGSLENSTTSSINLRYFSSDTNTIFPPYLEFKWDDSSYDSGSLSLLSTDIATISIKNAKEKYADSDTVRFRLSARPKYPTRSFVTSSIYLTEYRLPEASYWGIKDEFSEEMIVDFDTNYTKISADSNSSYFDVRMNSLQPERYYRLLVKTTLDSSNIILDNKNIFKVTRNG